jgi:hypothetical protein
MSDFRFILQPYKSPASRFHCPGCQHRRRTFTRYIDTATDEYLADYVGMCDRKDKCGYHFTPRQYFAENPDEAREHRENVSPIVPVSNKFNHLPARLVKDSMVQKAYIHNNFILFLANIFGWEWALQAAERYNIGTSKHWPGANVFWQVDAKGRVRTGKVMLYDQATGKRVKEPFNHIAWVHKIVGSAQSAVGSGSQLSVGSLQAEVASYKLRQCFFGEHLLKEDTKKMVGITESEKTAVMASIMMPDLVWLAAGCLTGLVYEKWQALKNRTVLLFPDVGGYDYWIQCARTLNLKIPNATFAVNSDMENTATEAERANGADMGDRWVAEWQEMTGFKSSSNQ